ncbi:multidrug effflux MFS transporter [Vibrio hippocampi]|uniref:Bcr/CflA family efflux transporter n=1 Tax=Vibrio hippocampi TaxID=654686 RepID=A0ABM8ZNR9_9VIBR|nr:multidrug effflux MFS transporter [Vibrio hippocampi]CAH0530159.1 Bicyclomycin resistance protein [Vibrio hippocampi]
MKTDIANSFNKTPMLLAMMIIATGQVGVSIYLPSLPMISEALSIDAGQAQWLVTLFLVGFGLSQLIYGPLSDAIGRRPVFILGQGIYLLGTLLCVLFSQNIYILVLGRLLQGLGAGSASVLGRSVLRDSYDGAQLTKALSYISMTASIMPIIAPVFGGWIAFHLGWQAVFWFVMVYLLAIFVLGWFILPETLPYQPRRFEPSKLLSTYAKLIINPQVIGSASYNWISYLGAVVSLSLFPYLMQQELGLTAAQYGSLMIIPSTGLLVGSVALNVFSRYVSTSKMLAVAIAISAFSGIWLWFTEMTVFNLLFAFTWLTVAQGLSFPISISLLLAPHKRQAGAVSALSGSIQMVIAGVFGALLVENWVTSQSTLAVFYVVSAMAMGLVLVSSQWRQHQVNAVNVID